VLDLVRSFEATNDLTLPYAVVERRPGDSAISVADPREAARRMGWRTRRSLADICRDGWAWQRANPEGYRSDSEQPPGRALIEVQGVT
jgi:UDP-glucose 4-epimerase